MLFRIYSTRRIPTHLKSRGYLIRDNWNDWFRFETLFGLVIVDSNGEVHDIGAVKIGQFQMSKEQRSPNLTDSFESLDDSFFSLGQDDSYYENLNRLGDETRDEILTALKDVVKDAPLFEKALDEPVMKTSLLRFVTISSVRGQFRRIITGGERLTDYNFVYKAPRNKGTSSPAMALEFHVLHESNPPTNIHVLIGRNGVGKTFLINNMIKSLIHADNSTKYGQFTFTDNQSFANLVSVTFSAFDESEPVAEQRDKSIGIQYSYVGLKRNKVGDNQSQEPKTPAMMRTELVKSIVACCKNKAKYQRWVRAISMLEADPIFQEADVVGTVDVPSPKITEEVVKEKTSELLKKLSSGHRIVLLTITKLIEKVEERTLVLIDEPETHLHPPLLSAFTRALSDLLINRNGVAIIATHSPVVLQEVPKSCVWKLLRFGAEARAERLEIESFGENVGALTSEVFGLEVTDSGFHQLLRQAVNEEDTYVDASEKFSNQLGMEAKAILRALAIAKNTQQN